MQQDSTKRENLKPCKPVHKFDQERIYKKYNSSCLSKDPEAKTLQDKNISLKTFKYTRASACITQRSQAKKPKTRNSQAQKA